MSHNIIIGTFKPFKVNGFKWSRDLDDISDSCTIRVPAICRMKKEGDQYENVPTGLQFTEGMPVLAVAGYDDNNMIRFKGFVRRINFSVPLEVECEGYAYQLRRKVNFSKAYQNTTVRKILEDLIEGTDIVLSSFIPDIPIDKVTFRNATGIQVLEWFKEKCLLTVYFNFEELYVGGLALEPKATVNFRLGWNTVKDSDLKFNESEHAEVRIEVGARNVQGEKTKKFAGIPDGQTKRLNTAIRDADTQQQIAEQKRKDLLNKGYEGSITAFLHPYVEPGMAVNIDDQKYPDRKGRYLVTGVEGSFTQSGGRQKIQIGYRLG